MHEVEPKISSKFWFELIQLIIMLHFCYSMIFVYIVYERMASGLSNNFGTFEWIVSPIRIIGFILIYIAPIIILIKIFVKLEKKEIKSGKIDNDYYSVEQKGDALGALLLGALIYLPFVIIGLVFIIVFW
ncbi:MAG: hypothetical protein ACW981_15320 [Candidatus Hodarchaeales archaeon]